MSITKLAEDVLLISLVCPHVPERGVHGLRVHVADVSEHVLQRGLHPLGHGDLAADVDIAASPTNDIQWLTVNICYILCGPLDPGVVDPGGVPGHQVLDVLLGLVRLPGEGHFSLKLERSRDVIRADHSSQETEGHDKMYASDSSNNYYNYNYCIYP